MKAFTVYQPYAYAIVAGIKPHETRPRRTNIRGRVAVHAGKRGFYAGGPLAVKQKAAAIRAISETEYEQKGERPVEELPYFPKGVVIGTVEIVDCVPVEDVSPTLTERERPALSEEDMKRVQEAWKLIQTTIKQFIEAVKEVCEKLKEILLGILKSILSQGPPGRECRKRQRQQEKIQQNKIIAKYKNHESKRITAVLRIYKPP
jgi:hypothetical protein